MELFDASDLQGLPKQRLDDVPESLADEAEMGDSLMVHGRVLVGHLARGGEADDGEHEVEREEGWHGQRVARSGVSVRRAARSEV